MRPIKFQVCAELARSMKNQRTYARACRAMLKMHNARGARFWLECWHEEREQWRKLLNWKNAI